MAHSNWEDDSTTTIAACAPIADTMPLVFKSIAIRLAVRLGRSSSYAILTGDIVPWTGRSEVDPRAFEVLSRNDSECLLLPVSPSHSVAGSYRVPIYCLQCDEFHKILMPPGAIVKLALRQMSEREFVEGVSTPGGWNLTCFNSNCIQPRHWVPMSKEDLADRHERCRNRISESGETGGAIPDNCNHHDPACEL